MSFKDKLNGNVQGAFSTMFETMQSIDKMIVKCKEELKNAKYHMPMEEFMQLNGDKHWNGGLSWCYMLIFQMRDAGET